MSVVSAALLFPVRPAASTQALSGRLWALIVPLLPALAFALYLWIRGCAPADAAVAGAALLAVVAGLGVGGAAACAPARAILRQPAAWGDRIGPCLVCAAWTPVLFLVLLLLARLLGAGGAAALFAGFSLLVWGVIVGIAVVAGGEETEHGRALVASCTGLTGSLIGLWAAIAFVHAQLLLAVPAPIETGAIRPGDLLLVRRESRPAPAGALVLVRDPATPEALLARVGPRDPRDVRDFEPIGVDEKVWKRANWEIAGRIFFRFGGPGGGSVVKARH